MLRDRNGCRLSVGDRVLVSGVVFTASEDGRLVVRVDHPHKDGGETILRLDSCQVQRLGSDTQRGESNGDAGDR